MQHADLTTEEWARLSALLDELFELPIDLRRGRLGADRRHDEKLKAWAEALLDADERSGSFMNGPAIPGRYLDLHGGAPFVDRGGGGAAGFAGQGNSLPSPGR